MIYFPTLTFVPPSCKPRPGDCPDVWRRGGPQGGGAAQGLQLTGGLRCCCVSTSLGRPLWCNIVLTRNLHTISGPLRKPEIHPPPALPSPCSPPPPPSSQTCQLVLGAGAMQSAGLKSISAKHLAVSCQAVHLLAVLLPQLRAGLVAPVAQQRRSLLLPEFDHLMHVGGGGHAGGGCREGKVGEGRTCRGGCVQGFNSRQGGADPSIPGPGFPAQPRGTSSTPSSLLQRRT